MTTLALLLVFPLLWPIVAKHIWKHEITLVELALNVVIGALVVSAGWALGKYAQAHDIEILNGQVTGKYSQRVSCEHSYSCRCRESCSGTGKNRSCSQVCDTCYDHDYDIDWNLKTSLGDIEIERVNRQGTIEPPRYSRAASGDPVAQSHAYQNYIKAAPDSLFNALSEKQALQRFVDQVPAYPDKVYDYHYVDRVLTAGVAVPDLAAWRQDLANALRVLGPAKQANVVVLFSKESDPQYASAVNAKWLGGKKNDVVVVFGTPRYPEIYLGAGAELDRQRSVQGTAARCATGPQDSGARSGHLDPLQPHPKRLCSSPDGGLCLPQAPNRASGLGGGAFGGAVRRHKRRSLDLPLSQRVFHWRQPSL